VPLNPKSSLMIIKVIDECEVVLPRLYSRGRVIIDRQSYSASFGKWCFYVPAIQVKLLYSVDGRCHCISDKAPSRTVVFNTGESTRVGSYTNADWRNIYIKPATRRAAENYVSSLRLQQAGLGPRVLGCAVVASFKSSYWPTTCVTSGIIVDNVSNYPPKMPATVEDLLSCGVVPDRIESCIRQQIRGYVTDLNSVVGVQLVDAESDVARIHSMLDDALFARKGPFDRILNIST